jgi:hypothetical protein
MKRTIIYEVSLTGSQQNFYTLYRHVSSEFIFISTFIQNLSIDFEEGVRKEQCPHENKRIQASNDFKARMKEFGDRIDSYSDICDRDVAKTLAILRSVQLGFLSENVLRDACHRQDRSGKASIPIEQLCLQVKERLPNFKI